MGLSESLGIFSWVWRGASLSIFTATSPCKPASLFIFGVAAAWQKRALATTLFYMEGDKLFLSQSQF